MASPSRVRCTHEFAVSPDSNQAANQGPDPLAWPAPAKLNLMLRVLGRRQDGYHRLQTVFQFIDRCDWLWFGVRDDGEIHRDAEIPGVPLSADLTVRAARALQAFSRLPAGRRDSSGQGLADGRRARRR